jgi:hypothetical protein
MKSQKQNNLCCLYLFVASVSSLARCVGINCCNEPVFNLYLMKKKKLKKLNVHIWILDRDFHADVLFFLSYCKVVFPALSNPNNTNVHVLLTNPKRCNKFTNKERIELNIEQAQHQPTAIESRSILLNVTSDVVE